MALYIEQENNKTKLQERITADLREKAVKNSLAGGDKPETAGFSPEDSKYLENTKETTSLALVWLLLGVAFLIALGYFIWFSQS